MPECVRIADQWHEHTAEVELVKMCQQPLQPYKVVNLIRANPNTIVPQAFTRVNAVTRR